MRLVAVDLDGVVWLGGTILPNAVQALTTVVERGFDLRYVSNNSTAHREAVSERLAAAGLPAGVDRVLTSGYVTARWLRQRLPEGAPVLVVGEAGLLRELAEAGLAPVRAGGEPAAPRPDGAAAAAPPRPRAASYQAVVVGMDRGFTFAALAQAQAAIIAGALFVGTNPDATFPTPSGLLPGAGSVVAAVATAAQKEPVFMGKPGLGLAEVLAAVTGVPASSDSLCRGPHEHRHRDGPAGGHDNRARAHRRHQLRRPGAGARGGECRPSRPRARDTRRSSGAAGGADGLARSVAETGYESQACDEGYRDDDDRDRVPDEVRIDEQYQADDDVGDTKPLPPVGHQSQAT